MEKLPEFIANHLFLFSLLVAILILLFWNIYGDTITGIRKVVPLELTRLMNHEDALVIDVRSPDDYKEGHIINAINIPATEITVENKKLEKHRQKPIIFYCLHGSDSGKAIRIIAQSGFDKLYILKGGLTAWRNANMPVTRDNKT